MEKHQEELFLKNEFSEKVRREIFHPIARHLTSPKNQEERIQDVTCQTYLMFMRYGLEKNRILPDAILVHSAKQRAVDLDRHFVPANGVRCNDVYDERNYRDGKVKLLRLNGSNENQREPDRNLEIAFDATPTEQHLNSTIDLLSWFEELSSRDRKIMELKYAGFNTAEIARRLEASYYNTQKRIKTLGYELAQRANVQIRDNKQREAA